MAADNIRKYVDDFNQKEVGVHATIVQDRSVNLLERRTLLIQNGAMGMILVLLFLSLFLNPRMAFWVAAGLPISFFGMFILAGIYGVTINVISLFGMIVVVGILWMTALSSVKIFTIITRRERTPSGLRLTVQWKYFRLSFRLFLLP